jgi:hypothetical protein
MYLAKNKCALAGLNSSKATFRKIGVGSPPLLSFFLDNEGDEFMTVSNRSTPEKEFQTERNSEFW